MRVTSRYSRGALRRLARTAQALARPSIESYCLAGAPLASGRVTRPGTHMRRLVLSALALLAACGTRPDPKRLAAVEKAALHGDAGAVARRLLSEAQFNDYGYPTADGRFLSTTDAATGDLAVRDLTTGALRRIGLKTCWGSSAYVENSRMSPDGRRIALAWSDDDERYSIRVV